MMLPASASGLTTPRPGDLHAVLDLLAFDEHVAERDEHAAGLHRVPHEAAGQRAVVDQATTLAGRERPEDENLAGLAALVDGAAGPDRPLAAEGEDAAEIRVRTHQVERGDAPAARRLVAPDSLGPFPTIHEHARS